MSDNIINIKLKINIKINSLFREIRKQRHDDVPQVVDAEEDINA